MDFYKGSIPVIDADRPDPAVASPDGFGRGYVPRDYLSLIHI